MGNNLGGMVFIVAGLALGYWVVTGRAVNFLHALNMGSANQQNQGTPWGQTTNPLTGQSGIPAPWNPLQMLNEQEQQATNASADYLLNNPNTNVSQNVPSGWISV
jgi:hypothetical protein